MRTTTARFVTDAEYIANLQAELSATKEKLAKAESSMRRMMKRLSYLLDEDQFAEMEYIADDAAISPPPIPPELAELERVNAELRKHLDRLGSMEAFVFGGPANPSRNAELLARINYARNSAAQKP